MIGLSLSNNEGWSFCYNGSQSIQVKDKFGIDHGEASSIRLNDLTYDEVQEWENSSEIDREYLIHEFLRNRFKMLGKHLIANKTHQIQCYIHEHQPHIVFGPYGLAGGGPWNWATGILGASKATFGILISPACPNIGAGLVSSGISDIGYAMQTEEEDINFKDYATQSTTSFVGGVTGGAILGKVSSFAGSSIAGKAFTSVTSSVSSLTSSTVTEAVIKKDKKVLDRLTPKNVAKHAAIGYLSGELTNFNKNAIEEGTKGIIKSSSALQEIAVKTFVGGTSGAVTSASIQISENLMSKQPVSLLKGVKQASINGATTGAVIGLSKAVSEQRQRLPKISNIKRTRILKKEYLDQEKASKPKTPSLSNKRILVVESEIQEKRIKVASDNTHIKRIVQKTIETKNVDKPKVPSLFGKRVVSQTMDIDSKKIIIKPQNSKEINNPFRRVLRSHFKENQPVEQSSPSTMIEVSSEQLAAAQKSVNQANHQYTNLQALSSYSSIDIENVATNIFNDTRNLGYYGTAKAIPYIEKRLAEDYGIPMGTLTDSLKNAYSGRHPDNNVPNCIQSALRIQQGNGIALNEAKQNLDLNTVNYQKLQSGLEITQPAPIAPPSISILEMVTRSENYARDTGYENNINVQMRYLATQITGTDHGDTYNQIYSTFLDESFKWQIDQDKHKPTQYGFLTKVTDLVVNGTTTVTVETNKPSFLKETLNFIGGNGMGIQTDGTNMQVGTMNHPNLVTVYQQPSNQGIEGFQIPKPLPSEKPSTSSSTTTVTIPVETLSEECMIIDTPKTTTSNTITTKPTTPVTPVDTIKPNVPNNSLTGTVVNTVKLILPVIDNVKGLEGLGTYAGNAVGKVTTTYSLLNRIDNPAYQNEPNIQQIGCAAWGQTVQTVAGLVTVPFGLPTKIIGGAILDPITTRVGDDAQQNCHDVINIFK